MNTLRRVVIALLVLTTVVSLPMTVFAQDGVTSTDVMYDAESLSAELRRLKTQYRGELEEYRRLENNYTVSKQQYEQLGTLASLEAGVNATQAAMESRARVLKTYMQILKVTLLQQTGVEVDQKQAAIEALDTTAQKLEAHHQKFTSQLDKVGLQVVSDDFVELSEEINNVSYRVLSLIAVGKLQSVYDKAFLLTDDMREQLATQGGALKQAERHRGFDETSRQLALIEPELKEAHGVIRDPQSSGYESVYDKVTKGLRETYTNLSQTLSFLQELTKL